MKKMKSFIYSMGPSFKTLVFGFVILLVAQSCDTQLEADMDKEISEKALLKQSKYSKERGQFGFQGIVFNDDMSQQIADAVITFSKIDEDDVRVTTSDASGSYKITLQAGKYYVTATATGFSSYSSVPGYFVVTGEDGYQTGNFFLEKQSISGFQGIVFNANDFNITIPGTTITFKDSGNPSVIYTAFSDASGSYKINLPQASYFVQAQASGYEVYDTTPGLFVCIGGSYQTGNFFLTPLPPPVSGRFGYQGTVYTQDMTQTIPNAVITFSKSDENYVVTTTSDASGGYIATLKTGKYYVTATATGFNSYSSVPGFFVVTGVNGYQTGNFFLEAEMLSGFQGIVFNTNDFNITIPGTYITFANSGNPSVVYSAISGPGGEYKINLPQASYFVKAQASGYEVYDTTPGMFVCIGGSYQTGNFFLTPLVLESKGR